MLQKSSDRPLEEPLEFYSGYADFKSRFLAFLIDYVLVCVVCWAIFEVLGLGYAFGDLGKIALGAAYFILMESSKFQATLGKLVFGLKVTNLEAEKLSIDRAATRFFAKFFTIYTLLLIFWTEPFTDKNQLLHDRLARALVFKK